MHSGINPKILNLCQDLAAQLEGGDAGDEDGDGMKPQLAVIRQSRSRQG